MLLSMDDIRELNKRQEQERLAAQAKAKAEPGLLQTAIEKPKTPFENLRDEHGTGGAILRMIGTGLSGGLLGDVLTPETGAAAQAEYASNLKLYDKYREMQLVDPHHQAYADVLMDPNATPEQRAYAAVLAGGVGEYDPNSTVLSSGQTMVGPTGNTLATGGPREVNPTSVMQNAQETAKGYGIPLDSRAYSDLIAAYAEPSGSQTLADGTVVPFNTVDKVLADWRSGVYGQSGQAAAGQPAGGSSGLGVTPGGGVTPEGATGATVRGVMNEEIAENLKISEQKISFYNDLEGVISQFGEWDPDANDGEGAFVANEATRDNYGAWDNHVLNLGSYRPFKGTEEKNSLVFMDQLVDMLTVDERGKLKGQGQITEGETAMLKRAVTALQNRDLGDTAMQRELAKLMRGLIARRQKFIDLQDKYGSDGQGGSNATDFDTMWENS